MVALQSYEQANGFSAVSADELYFINGGSGSWSFSNGGLTYTSGNTSVTLSGTLKPSVTVTVTIRF